jgi:hypothetical protein
MKLSDHSGKAVSSVQILKGVRDLPEQLELTEHDWYEYHYYLKRNLFLLNKLQNLPESVRNIYLMEPFETFIGSVLSTFGYRVRYHHTDRLEAQEFIPNELMSAHYSMHETEGYDVILLLNVLERRSEHTVVFLKQTLSLLKNHGKVFLTAENIASFRNRIKLLFGMNIFYTMDRDDLFHFRQFGISELFDIFSQINFSVKESSFIGPYQPFKMEPLTLRRYLLKYFSYFIMKAVPGFKDTIFMMAEKG